jgi:hypothetical protein
MKITFIVIFKRMGIFNTPFSIQRSIISSITLTSTLYFGDILYRINNDSLFNETEYDLEPLLFLRNFVFVYFIVITGTCF